MFKTFFSKSRHYRDAHVLYGKVVAQSRHERFYEHFAVPDTLDGRFEMLTMHLFLVLHRLKDEDAAAKSVSQAMFDAFIADMDIAMREVAVGDQIVPKKLKKMMRVFYGRTGVYQQALSQEEREALLSEILARNLEPEADDSGKYRALAQYMSQQASDLDALNVLEITSDHQIFESPPL